MIGHIYKPKWLDNNDKFKQRIVCIAALQNVTFLFVGLNIGLNES